MKRNEGDEAKPGAAAKNFGTTGNFEPFTTSSDAGRKPTNKDGVRDIYGST